MIDISEDDFLKASKIRKHFMWCEICMAICSSADRSDDECGELILLIKE